MKFKYCPKCSSSMNDVETNEDGNQIIRNKCENKECGFINYVNIKKINNLKKKKNNPQLILRIEQSYSCCWSNVKKKTFL